MTITSAQLQGKENIIVNILTILDDKKKWQYGESKLMMRIK